MSISLVNKPAEKLVTLHGITWEQFKAIEAQLEDKIDAVECMGFVLACAASLR